VIRRIASAVVRRLSLPFRQNRDQAAFRQLSKALARIPRYTPGIACAAGWNLQYVDSAALLSCFDVVVVKRWNDFITFRDDPIILDCGANIGITVLHYKRLYPNARITAFEPDRRICNVLRRNLAVNNISDVKVVEAAVWKSEGQHEFFSEGADGSRLSDKNSTRNSGLASLTPQGAWYTVETVRLADYLSESSVDFVKLDIESAESEVIADCTKYLHKVQNMVIEFHMMNERPQVLASTLSVLADAGFHVSVNSYGPWIDLTHKPTSPPTSKLEFDQYLLICAWRS
jgi:FkbM family methyltransferase